jgi:hypothetical protein
MSVKRREKQEPEEKIKIRISHTLTIFLVVSSHWIAYNEKNM